MIAELNAIRAALDVPTSQVRSHIGDATGKPVPFRVLWAPPGGRDADGPVSVSAAWSARIGITCVARDAESALALAEDTIDRLTPNHGAAILPGVAGRRVSVVFSEARDVQIDRTTTFPGVDHPAFAAILFTIHSQPQE